MKIVWDEPKRQQNIARHGLDFADLSIGFFAEAILVPPNWGGRWQSVCSMAA